MEAVANFQQIYTVPSLQMLGMSLSLTYITGVVSGPITLLILPLLGWLIDRGHNPQTRKFASIVFAACISTLGMLCLLSANVLHLQYLFDYNTTVHTETAFGGSVNSSIFLDSDVDLSVDDFGKNIGQDWSNDSFIESGEKNSTANGSPDMDDAGIANVPFKAGLGMLGFIFMDLGFDVSNCFVKAFMVTCSARTEHTSLFVLGVVMGSVGGVTNALLGIVDFTSLLGLNHIDGAKLTIQTSVQDLLLILMIFLGLLSTFITGRRQLRKLHEQRPVTGSLKAHGNRSGAGSIEIHENSTASYNSNPKPEITYTSSSLVGAFENSIRSLGGSSIYVDPSVSLVEENPSSMAEDAPLLEDGTLKEEEEDGNHVTSVSFDYGAIESVVKSCEEKASVKTVVQDAQGFKSDNDRVSWLHNPKVRIFFVCLTVFFGNDAMAMYTYCISDFVGKGVYGGDPTAEPGSDGLSRYQEGIKSTSWALLVYFITYLITSIVQPNILAFLGFRMEFLLLQTLLIITMLLTALTVSMEAVFILSVVAGMHRTCFFTMPYAVTNDIVQSVDSKDNGRIPVSLAMSLVAVCMPLGYCALFTWVGVVEQLTGDVSLPMWLGSAAGFLTVVAFLFVGKV